MPVAAVVAAGAFVYVVVLRDPADPVAVGEVVDRFREDGGEASASPGEAGPPPGVYVYATTGSEGVDALDGSEHPYPAESTITVAAAGDRCVTARWDVLAQRWDDETLCPVGGEGSGDRDGAGAWQRPETTLFHSFFNQDETRSYTCEGDAYVPPPTAEEGDTLSWTCESGGSDRSGDSHEQGTGTVVGVEDVTVGGVDRPALRVRYETEVSGETTGAGTVERWYALDRYPLMLREVKSETTSSQTVIGTVNYHEDYELVLTAWEPRR